MLVVMTLSAACSRTPAGPSSERSPHPAPSQASSQQPRRLLIFSKTAGFRHDAIGPAADALAVRLGTAFQVDRSEDATAFDPQNLGRYSVVVFLLTTGDILDDAQQSAFEGFIRAGGGYVGIHSATDTEYAWPFYGGLVGAYFKSHPPIQQASVKVADAALLGEEVPDPWIVTDEWYNFRNAPTGGTRILLTVDESTYSGGEMGEIHPITWCGTYEGGRSFYTAMGHGIDRYGDPTFMALLAAGIDWASGGEQLRGCSDD